MGTPTFRLRFDPGDIGAIAGRYAYARGDASFDDLIAPVQRRGFLTLDDLRRVRDWKAPRIGKRLERNTEEDVREFTRIVFATTSERARVEVLRLLHGVEWPMASVILHFFHPDPYPVLDFRAVWALGVDVPSSYSFDFWIAYVGECRRLAEVGRVDMRTLDRALWQHSKERQPKAGG